VYVPNAFQQTDLSTLHQFITRHSFAVLCSTDDQGVPCANHLPLLLDRQATPPGVLVGHMARANRQWQHADGKPVLVVFSGPHHYISPAWYQASSVVPTWNYLAVHVTGLFKAVHDRDALLRIVQDAVAFHESSSPRPWTLDLEESVLNGLLRQIVGFEIQITGFEGKWKLGQNRPAEQRERAAQALRNLGGEDALAIAALMEQIGA
jgi:transcriptional regulator